MEANKPEAQRCCEIAERHLRAGNPEKALKFLNKSIKLYPTQQAQVLRSSVLERIQSGSTGSSAGASSSGGGRQSSFSSNGGGARPAAAPAPAPEPERRTSETGRSYTDKQVDIANQILAQKGKQNQHFKVLGVDTSSDSDQIKRAYRKLALKLHPDKNAAPGADEAFKLVGQAYSVLSDDEKRAAYLRFGDDGEGTSNHGSSGGMGGARYRQAAYTH
eukprot:CAMPEP_0118863316 /NCGR_PEP_ID=MMETSP1163-20130328/8234_1 /TAXON_ID=124430 /ORGANISM="Phaeomonas parva, Strain CCMP2877" /LENGTH=217 /DNA_ID=CAMNT_0006797311 /DNA_START=93 /DNA_END=743 /DNA_ORIENTATION=-